jgi:hypothetical protein
VVHESAAPASIEDARSAEASETTEHLACPFCETILAEYDGPLSEDEARGLLLALNDEHHAWAVYDQVIADHGDVRPFRNIIRSEARHAAALANLFERYDLPVPENPWVRNVERYETVQAAARAGVEAEIANVELYDRIFASTDRPDILQVYENLRWASQERHLPAFRRWAGDDGSRGAGRGWGGGQGRGGGPGWGRGPGRGGADAKGRRRMSD